MAAAAQSGFDNTQPGFKISYNLAAGCFQDTAARGQRVVSNHSCNSGHCIAGIGPGPQLTLHSGKLIGVQMQYRLLIG